ncbi:YaaR family protein [Fonticella tunisiensis]|uniref:DUF327 family protein n=1 Tax=Fonticella tunisiensis TaxID=1096341 RepID=A0A4V3EUT3_9CLOT|nr:YaaR family protein [Fonticella tunisiensis]TDT61177.1 hypothetical protein EDD71_10875 [Fonticella tunisiensis]
MRVNRISGRRDMKNVTFEKASKTNCFSVALDLANREQTEERLKDMLKDIENIGKRLISTRSVEDAKEYKRKVKEYIGFIVKNIYVLKREPGPFNYGVHTRIEIINKKLDELTKNLIEEQKETIEIADKIEEIKGLLIDSYK